MKLALRFLLGAVVVGVTYVTSLVVSDQIVGALYPDLAIISIAIGGIMACLSFLLIQSSLLASNQRRTSFYSLNTGTKIAVGIISAISLFMAVLGVSRVASKSAAYWEQVSVVPPQYVHYDFIRLYQSKTIADCVNCNLIRADLFTIDGDRKSVLFMHPPSRLSYNIVVPVRPELSLSISLAPAVWQVGKGDGVQFDLYVDNGQAHQHVFSRYIDPKNVPADHHWHDYDIDLSLWAGQTVTITFATGCGPNGDCRYDWAGWGEPRIVQPIAYSFLTELPGADHGGADERQVREDTLTINYEPRAILFAHPPGWVTYHVEVPEQAGLHFGLGMDPAVWSPDKGDGVEYTIYVRRPEEPNVLYQVFDRYIDPKNNPADRQWLDEVVDLSAYGGQTVDIIFAISPGPAGNADFDWGGWSTPVLVADDMALLNPNPRVTVWYGGVNPQ
jgi:hypothetical protein